MLKITVDTNILISATITKGIEFELLKSAKLRKIEIVLSPQILKEFKNVVSRPKFGFSQEQIIKVLKQIISISTIIIPSSNVTVIKDDPDDNRILECAVDGNSDYIVSGDKHLLKLKKYKDVNIVKTKRILSIINKL